MEWNGMEWTLNKRDKMNKQKSKKWEEEEEESK